MMNQYRYGVTGKIGHARIINDKNDIKPIKNIVFIALVTLKLIMFESNISETSKGRAMIKDIYLIDIARPSKKP